MPCSKACPFSEDGHAFCSEGMSAFSTSDMPSTYLWTCLRTWLYCKISIYINILYIRYGHKQQGVSREGGFRVRVSLRGHGEHGTLSNAEEAIASLSSRRAARLPTEQSAGDARGLHPVGCLHPHRHGAMRVHFNGYRLIITGEEVP